MTVGWKNTLYSTLGVFLLFPVVAVAQFSPNFGDFNIEFDSLSSSGFGAPEVSIVRSPQLPQPNETYEASINDFSSALYGSQIDWVLNGEIIPSASNQRSVTLTAPAAGETQTLEVFLTKPNGQAESFSTTVTPSYLDIIIEPQTRVPDFYLGRALPSLGSVVNVTALVDDGTGLRTTDLIYTWKAGQQVIGGGPLRGGYKTSFTMPRGDQMILSVDVTEFDGTPVASRAVMVHSFMPDIHFYEVSALFGVQTRSIGQDYILSGNTATLKAEPYHLDTRVYNDPDIIEWELGNQTVTNTSNNPYEVTIQRSGASANSQLQFHVRDTSEVLQGGRESLTISF